MIKALFFGALIAAIMFSRFAIAAKNGFLSRDAYLRQRPLLITGICAWVAFFIASVLNVRGTTLYLVATACLVSTVSVWIWIRRKERSGTSSPHAT